VRQIRGTDPDMPQTFGLEYLIEYMLTIGPGLSGAMGMIALDFREIHAFRECSGLPLSGFECSTIRDLSRAYVGQTNISAKSPAPWVKGVEDMEAYNIKREIEESKKLRQEDQKHQPISKPKKKR